jgi:parvulin-like peptidyl-prolyl isomerase
MQKEQELRTSLAEDVVKRMVINDIISQMVTTREAMNRHYENRPPLDGVYKFYLNNTLRKFVEAGIRKRISVSDDEIASYYNNNQALYSEPESFSYAIIQGDSDLLNPISAALAQGADFFDQAQIHSLDAQIKTVVGDKIRPEVKIQLALLKKGEVTQPFALDSEAAIGRLLNHTDMKLIPLEQVRSSIKKILTEEKFGVAKTAYLAKLRSVREIAVKESVWNKLKEEYAK